QAASNNMFAFTVDVSGPAAFTITGITGDLDSTADTSLDDGLIATVNWNQTTGGVSAYHVTLYENDGTTVKCAGVAKSPSQFSHTFSGCALTSGSTYKAKVTAQDLVGNVTEATNSLFAFTVNDSHAPLAFTITGATGSADIVADNMLTSGTWVTANWNDAS